MGDKLFLIELGEQVKDSITGFIGVTTARAEYLNGCVTYQVETKDQPEKEVWIDEQRLKVKKGRIFTAPTPEMARYVGGGKRSHPPSIHP